MRAIDLRKFKSAFDELVYSRISAKIKILEKCVHAESDDIDLVSEKEKKRCFFNAQIQELKDISKEIEKLTVKNLK